jgi:hypothetical protein
MICDLKPRLVRPAASTLANPSELAFRMQIHGECINEASSQWRFARDGVFGAAKQGDTTIEAVFDGSSIYYRLSAP